ncbi:hypothetical protein P7H17_16830 [Paenibacillus larvae]|nr:hypothetical protein [Paenibacillus larvae]MDT2287372.1 hypothetical protein [Paenibacillus larvae]
MIYGIKVDDYILATYDTPEEAYEAAKFGYEYLWLTSEESCKSWRCETCWGRGINIASH